jgi:LemA protein
MQTINLKSYFYGLILFLAFTFSGCGYNSIQSLEEEVTSQWADVLNQYKRRSDLIPNLVKTVKGYASHEKETLEAVINARAQVGKINLNTNDLNNPEKMAEFSNAQGELTGALSRLLVVAEQYPNLQASTNFRELQAQLEGTENRVTVARTRFIESVKKYNTFVRSFPNNLTAKIFGYKTKESFKVDDVKAVENAPEVNF